MSKQHHEFTLSSGRTVSLHSLKQWSVYAGLLEGLPTRRRNDAEIEDLIADARLKDGHDPVLIEPNQHPIEYAGRYPFGEPAALPAIGCDGSGKSAASPSGKPAAPRRKERAG